MMARYKPYDVNQVTLIPVSFPDQILSGSFEYALNEIVDEHIDLRAFEARYQNDETGCLAYDPAVLLKIVLFGYYKGLISSQRLAEACQRNVQFKALTADTQPHFTTIAHFVATMHQEIAGVFRDVLIYADVLELIGKDTFAIDGCKLPSNASKECGFFYRLVRYYEATCSAGESVLQLCCKIPIPFATSRGFKFTYRRCTATLLCPAAFIATSTPRPDIRFLRCVDNRETRNCSPSRADAQLSRPR